MDVKNKTIASEIIAGQANRLKDILFELDCTVDDLLEKGKFALAESMELFDEAPDTTEKACAFAYNQKRINMLICIAFDYLAQAQSTLNTIVIRERRKQQEE